MEPSGGFGGRRSRKWADGGRSGEGNGGGGGQCEATQLKPALLRRRNQSLTCRPLSNPTTGNRRSGRRSDADIGVRRPRPRDQGSISSLHFIAICLCTLVFRTGPDLIGLAWTEFKCVLINAYWLLIDSFRVQVGFTDF